MAPQSKGEAMPNNAPSIFGPQHNDPDARVMLVSSDNVSFRVHAWYMAQKRYVSNDQLDN
jgi:hypothetical protein